MLDPKTEELLARYRTVLSDRLYYQISIAVSPSGIPQWHINSEWTGWHDLERRIERRKASFVDGALCVQAFEDLKVPYIVVNDQEALSVFLALGGNAIIEKEVAERSLPELLKDGITAPDGELGFRSVGRLPKEVLNRAPSKALRVRVIKRDGWKCRICGRRPENHTDIELHVHHVRPWALGGLTEERNLITLCSSCHDGLRPHFETDLFDHLAEFRTAGVARDEDLARYRQVLARRSQEEEKRPTRRYRQPR